MGRVRVCRTSIVSILVVAPIAIVSIALALAPVALPLGSSPARADGDPASDVLLGENVFYPYTPPVSPSLRKALDAEAAAAGRAHFPIKIALIHSPLDLGAVPNLFDKPQQYANFLDQEISFQGRRPLLVVMPDGYGVQGLNAASAAVAGSLAKPGGVASDDLARAGVRAVGALAAAGGYEVGAGQKSSPAGSGPGATTIVLIALVSAAIAAATIPLARRRREVSLRRHRVPSRRDGGHGTSRSLRRLRHRAPASRGASRGLDTFVFGSSGGVVQPRIVAGLVLILGGVLWAIARGLQSYGLNPVELVYDFDQPPLLLSLVGGWLLYRSRGR
jgi:hypothetical protein